MTVLLGEGAGSQGYTSKQSRRTRWESQYAVYEDSLRCKLNVYTTTVTLWTVGAGEQLWFGLEKNRRCPG